MHHNNDLSLLGRDAVRRQHIGQARDTLQSFQRLVVRTALGQVDDDAIVALGVRLFASLRQRRKGSIADHGLGLSRGTQDKKDA